MTSQFVHLAKTAFVATLLCGVLAACAPPASAPPQTGNLSLDMRRLQSALDRQEQAVQELNLQIAELKENQQRQALQIEQLQQPQTTQPGYPTAPVPQSDSTTATAVTGEGSPTEVYLQAFGDYASGRYQSAIYGFESFLQRFPNNSYASNAQFWLGDCYFNQQQYAMAIQEFNRVISDYQGAAKSPDALYKIAVAHLQLGAPEDARNAIDILNQRYPKSSATQKAQELVIP